MFRHTQTIRRLLPTNYLSVFEHFVGLALKGLWYVLLNHIFLVINECNSESVTTLRMSLAPTFMEKGIVFQKTYSAEQLSKVHKNSFINRVVSLRGLCKLFNVNSKRRFFFFFLEGQCDKLWNLTLYGEEFNLSGVNWRPIVCIDKIFSRPFYGMPEFLTQFC